MYHLKIVNTSQVYIHKYGNLQRKIDNCNTNIHFNQKCLTKHLIENYATISIPNTSPASKFTQPQPVAVKSDLINF